MRKIKVRKGVLVSLAGTGALLIGSPFVVPGVHAQSDNQELIQDKTQVAAAEATSTRLIEAVSMMADLEPSSVTDQTTLESEEFKASLAARVHAVYADSQFETNFEDVQRAAQLIHDEGNYKHYDLVTLGIDSWHGATRNTADGSVTSSFRGALTFHFKDHSVTESNFEWSVTTTGLDEQNGNAKLISYVAREIQ